MVPHVITSCYHFFSIDVLASISVNFPGLFPLFLLVNVNMCLFHLVAINAKPLLQANNGAIASGKCITSHLALTEKKQRSQLLLMYKANTYLFHIFETANLNLICNALDSVTKACLWKI